MCLFCSMLALIPQSGDFSGAALGVRSVALLQVAKKTPPNLPFKGRDNSAKIAEVAKK